MSNSGSKKLWQDNSHFYMNSAIDLPAGRPHFSLESGSIQRNNNLKIESINTGRGPKTLSPCSFNTITKIANNNTPLLKWPNQYLSA